MVAFSPENLLGIAALAESQGCGAVVFCDSDVAEEEGVPPERARTWNDDLLLETAVGPSFVSLGKALYIFI